MTAPAPAPRAFTALADLPAAPPVPPRRRSRVKMVALAVIVTLIVGSAFTFYRLSIPAYAGTSVHAELTWACSNSISWTAPNDVRWTSMQLNSPIATTVRGSIPGRNDNPGGLNHLSGTMFFDDLNNATFSAADGTTIAFRRLDNRSFASVACAIN